MVVEQEEETEKNKYGEDLVMEAGEKEEEKERTKSS